MYQKDVIFNLFLNSSVCKITGKKGFLFCRDVESVSASGRTGFTLIELLVVVLIIGILASVAVPQYQQAVDKSRFMTYLQTAHSIRRAEEVFYLANGSYTPDLEALDIDHSAGCEAVTALNNEWKCPDGFFIDLVSGNNLSFGALRLSLCPGSNTGSTACSYNRIAFVLLPFEYAAENYTSPTCGANNTRGLRLCKSLGTDVLN